jgi:hypothetical protein
MNAQRQHFQKASLWLIPVIIAGDYLVSFITNSLKIPFFLDSWATSAGVMFGGPVIGILGGVGYNLLMAGTLWGWASWLWVWCSVLVALMTWLFWKRGWVDLERPVKLVLAGLTTGVLNSILAFGILILFQTPDVPVLANTGLLSKPILNFTQSPLISIYLENLVIEMMDKSVSLFMAALAVFAYREMFPVRGQKLGRSQRLAAHP